MDLLHRTSKISAERGAAIAGFAFVIVGAFLPWAKISAFSSIRISESGLEGDGVVTLALAAAGAVVLMLPIRPVLPAVCAGLALGIGAFDAYDIWRTETTVNGADASRFVSREISVGLYLTIMGAAVALLGSLRILKESSGVRPRLS